MKQHTRTVHILLFCLTLFCLITACPAAAQMPDKSYQEQIDEMYEYGLRALENQRYDMAIQCFRTGAKEGHVPSQKAYADMLLNGTGMRKNIEEAIKWYRTAAEHGDTDSQLALGDIYSNGIDVYPDPMEAEKWYAMAKGSENSQSQPIMEVEETKTALMLTMEAFSAYQTQEVISLTQEALTLLQTAAAQPTNTPTPTSTPLPTKTPQPAYTPTLPASNLFNLGMAAFNQKDYPTALNYFSQSADLGNAKAIFYLGSMYEYGWGVEKSDEMAANYYRLAADQGHAKAQSDLGFMYEQGYGVEKSLSKALEYYEAAAAQGDEYAESRIQEVQTALTATAQPPQTPTMSPEELIRAAQETAEAWHSEAETQGVTDTPTPTATEELRPILKVGDNKSVIYWDINDPANTRFVPQTNLYIEICYPNEGTLSWNEKYYAKCTNRKDDNIQPENPVILGRTINPGEEACFSFQRMGTADAVPGDHCVGFQLYTDSGAALRNGYVSTCWKIN